MKISIHTLDDIRAKDITIAKVRQKIKGHPLLSSIDAKRVCDKVRSTWKFGEQNSEEVLDHIPDEDFSDKIERMFEKMIRMLVPLQMEKQKHQHRMKFLRHRNH